MVHIMTWAQTMLLQLKKASMHRSGSTPGRDFPDRSAFRSWSVINKWESFRRSCLLLRFLRRSLSVVLFGNAPAAFPILVRVVEREHRALNVVKERAQGVG